MAKAKKEKAPAEPFWNELVEIWFNFCKKKFSEPPTFDGSAPRDLKFIISTLHDRAVISDVEWTLEVATARFQKFLEFAYSSSEWLQKNWLLSNLNRQKDAIFFNIRAAANK